MRCCFTNSSFLCDLVQVVFRMISMKWQYSSFCYFCTCTILNVDQMLIRLTTFLLNKIDQTPFFIWFITNFIFVTLFDLFCVVTEIQIRYFCVEYNVCFFHGLYYEIFNSVINISKLILCTQICHWRVCLHKVINFVVLIPCKHFDVFINNLQSITVFQWVFLLTIWVLFWQNFICIHVRIP